MADYNIQLITDASFYACDLDTGLSTFVENTTTPEASFYAQSGVNVMRYVSIGEAPASDYDQVIGTGSQAIGIPGTGQVIGIPR